MSNAVPTPRGTRITTTPASQPPTPPTPSAVPSEPGPVGFEPTATSRRRDAASEAEVVRAVRARVEAGLGDAARAAETAGRVLNVDERRALAGPLITRALDAVTDQALSGGRAGLDALAEERVTRAVFDALFGMGGLQHLLDDPRIEDVDVDGYDNVYVRHADGSMHAAPPVAASDAELVDIVRTVAARSGLEERRLDRSHPMLTVQLEDGSRLFAATHVCERPCVTVRRHRHLRVTLAHLVELGMLDSALHAFFAAAVQARKNIVIGGAIGVGKTTMLRALAAQIPPVEKIVTIEDTFELGLNKDKQAHPNATALQARDANLEGVGAIDQADLVRAALRMGAHRVIVGEVRGAEVVSMLNVMSQGTDGSMATVHASSSAGVFSKLATYAVQAPERLTPEATHMLIADAVHLVVHLARSRDGARVVSSVREVTGTDERIRVASNDLWRPGADRRAVPAVRMSDRLLEDLTDAGYHPGWAERGWSV